MSTEFRKGDKVELTDSLKFQFGAKRTYHSGTVVAVVDGDGMQVVATVLEETALGVTRDGPRIDYVIEGVETPLVLIERTEVVEDTEPPVKVTTDGGGGITAIQTEPSAEEKAAISETAKREAEQAIVEEEAATSDDPFGPPAEVAPKKAAPAKRQAPSA